MSCCSEVTKAGENPWNTRGVIATVTVAVITLVVCAILAILVSQSVITLPSQLSVANLLIAGAAGAVLFGLISLAIKYCCCRSKQETEVVETVGYSALHPNGEGKVGAVGDPDNRESFIVNTGQHKDPFK